MYKVRTKSRSKTKKQPRVKAARPYNAVRLRFYTIAVIILSIAGLMVMTTGSASERMAQFALPLLKGAGGGAGAENETSEGDESRQEADTIKITRADVDEGVSDELRIEVLNPKTPAEAILGGDEPRILIYHTHTTEAYRQTETYKYEESGSWRTKEQDKSIVAVGEELARILSEQYGCNVIHDTTDHEPPKLATSYTRSLETMLEYKRQYPSLELYIDVHRDAGKDPSFTVVDGKRVAHMMFVVGTGEGATGTGFGEMPDFASNFALANAITENIRGVNHELMRNIRVKTSRYNQHVSDHCLLVEVGDNASTLEEALNAIPYLAKAIVETLGGGTAETFSAEESSPPSAQEEQSLWTPKESL